MAKSSRCGPLLARKSRTGPRTTARRRDVAGSSRNGQISEALPVPAGQGLEVAGLVRIERAGSMSASIRRFPDPEREAVLGREPTAERQRLAVVDRLAGVPQPGIEERIDNLPRPVVRLHRHL